jgi:hypothetical protein
MTTRPRLPGTLLGLLDAGTRLYTELQTSDDLLAELLSCLNRIERTVRAGDDVGPLLFEIAATARLGAAGREQLAATLRRFGPDHAAHDGPPADRNPALRLW